MMKRRRNAAPESSSSDPVAVGTWHQYVMMVMGLLGITVGVINV